MYRLGKKSTPMMVFLAVWIAASCSKGPRAAFEGSGTLEATEILLSAKTAGTVMELSVREGDAVGEGQAIARVETEKMEIQKRQLTAGLEELRLNVENAARAAVLARETYDAADKKFARIRSLHVESSVSQQQYEDAETAYKASKTQHENASTSLRALRAKEEQLSAQIGLVESQLRDATVVCPISGTVLETYVDRGEVARPGGPVASVADLSRMWIKVYLKETDLARIRLNGEATLSIDSAPGRAFQGRVAWISPKAEFTPKVVQTRDARSDLVYAAKIDVPNPDGTLKIGMPADVTIR